MANYYTDHPEYDFYLNHPEMQRVVELKERNFADKDKYEDAPVDFEDAIENYKRVLEITGDIAANIIEPNSEDVDLEGPHLVDGRMHYASKTYENIEATRQAGLWGISMPRRYNGLNMPITPYSMASEIVSAADAGFQNIWSLQDSSRLSMSLVLRSSARSIFPVSALARPCQWTSPSRTLVLTSSALCSRLHRTRTAHGV